MTPEQFRRLLNLINDLETVEGMKLEAKLLRSSEKDEVIIFIRDYYNNGQLIDFPIVIKEQK